jgi:lipoprotein signal peptidase
MRTVHSFTFLVSACIFIMMLQQVYDIPEHIIVRTYRYLLSRLVRLFGLFDVGVHIGVVLLAFDDVLSEEKMKSTGTSYATGTLL